MACALTQGRAIDCRNSTGGISEILIANFGDITIDTVAAGVSTALTQAGATNFYRYSLKRKRFFNRNSHRFFREWNKFLRFCFRF